MNYWRTKDGFDAIKFQVNEYGADHGFNLADMWKRVVRKHDDFWRNECKTDWEQIKRERTKLRFWIVQTVDVLNQPGKTVAVVETEAEAKAVVRHYKKIGHKMFYFSEPIRYW